MRLPKFLKGMEQVLLLLFYFIKDLEREKGEELEREKAWEGIGEKEWDGTGKKGKTFISPPSSL